MAKKYQVFVSSTFTDLVEARGRITRALYEMGHIAAGMEYFPAIDQEQIQFIKKVIDDCDYYIILVGNRYGSVSPDGLSYTEMEYDYAISKGIKVIALLHDDPSSLPSNKSDMDSAKAEKLVKFREKLRAGRLVRTWSENAELPGLVAISLQTTINTYPARGWVRGDVESTEDLLLQINSLREQKESSEKEIMTLREEVLLGRKPQMDAVKVDEALEATIPVSTETRQINTNEISSKIMNLSLGFLFLNAGVDFYGHKRASVVRSTIEAALARNEAGGSVSISAGSFDVITYTLQKLGLIRVTVELEDVERLNIKTMNIAGGARFKTEKVPRAYWAMTSYGRDVIAKSVLPKVLLSAIDRVERPEGV